MQFTTRYVGYQLAETRRQKCSQSNNHRTSTVFKHFKTIIPRSYRAKFGSVTSEQLIKHIAAETL